MAKVTSTFLSVLQAPGVRYSTDHGGCILDPAGAELQPAATASSDHTNPWHWITAGGTGTYTLPSAVYTSLAGGTVDSDGSGRYVDASGALHWLGVSGGAVAVTPDAPPPPPPP